MPSMTYFCKACGEELKYPAAQDQDHQPTLFFDQRKDGVTIYRTDDKKVIFAHHCTGGPTAGAVFNLPAQ